jgi:hypothetical protein
MLPFLCLSVPEGTPLHDRTTYNTAEGKLFTFWNVAGGNGIGREVLQKEKKRNNACVIRYWALFLLVNILRS